LFGDGEAGIFARWIGGGPILTVASTRESFTALDASPTMNATEVAFTGSSLSGDGVFVAHGRHIKTIADTSGPFGIFSGGPVINASGMVVFHACLKVGACGVFVGDGAAPPQTVADDTGPIRNASRPSTNRSGTIAFAGESRDRPAPSSGYSSGRIPSPTR
jgi:hypothetical protein